MTKYALKVEKKQIEVASELKPNDFSIHVRTDGLNTKTGSVSFAEDYTN